MADTTIGALSVRITADTRGLKKGFKQSESLLQKSRKSLNDNAMAWAKWSAAGVAASATLGAAIFKSQASSIRELKATSFAANELVEDFQRGAFAAQKFGIEQDKFGDILKDVQDRIGDFVTTGGGPMLDFFEQVAPKIGITADAFRGLSGQDALGLFVKSLEDANLSQEEMIFHMEAMASDSTLLIPLFKDNAKALKQFTEEAKNLGIGLSEIDVLKVEQASNALNDAAGIIDTALKQATIELAPIVTALSKQFKDAGIEAGGMGKAVGDTFSGVISAAGFVVDVIASVDRTFQILGSSIASVFLGVKLAILSNAKLISSMLIGPITGVIDTLSQLTGVDITPDGLKDFSKDIDAEFELTKTAIAIGLSDINELLMAPLPSTALKASIEEAKKAANELAEITAAANLPVEVKAIQAPQMLEASSGTQALIDRFASEEQLQKSKFESDQKQLDEALAKKELSETTHKELMLALEKENIQTLKALRLGATEAETAARLEALQSRFASETELENDKFALDQESLILALENKQLTKDEFNLLDQELTQSHEDIINDIKAKAAAIAQKQQLRALSSGQTLLALGGKKTEKAVKGLAITQAIIKGKTAAVSAFEAGMSTGGPWAPATAALYTAASIANTGSMIASIAGGGKSAPRPSGGTPRVAGGSTGGTGQTQAVTQRRFDLTLVGSGMFTSDQVRGLMAQIGEEVGDGVEFNVIQG